MRVVIILEVYNSCEAGGNTFENARRSPNVGFLATQILAIPCSQIEMEHIFSIARVLCNLQQCRLDLENLNALVIIPK